MTIFVLFFLELMMMRYGNFSTGDHSHENDHETTGTSDPGKHGAGSNMLSSRVGSIFPVDDHLGHSRLHTDNEDVPANWEEHGIVPETYGAQMTAIFILEFGVIFHSIFIGLTLAVAGQEFTTLYVVLVFHQTFEGLGLGARLASAPWPKSKRWTPYILACAYGLTTPIAIAVGLAVRRSYPPGSQTTLIVNGVFDSVSAGILIYTGLVELMAHEFMFSNDMRKAPIRVVLCAFGLMCLGAGK